MLRLFQGESTGMKRLASEVLFRASTAPAPELQAARPGSLTSVAFRASEGDDLE